MKRKNVDMLSGSIIKGLLSMAIPIMIMNVMQNIFNMIDMTALEFFSDDRSVGAVGACGSLISLCTSLLIGLSAGSNVVVAKRIGSGDRDRADKAVMTSLLISIAGGILLGVVGVTFAETFLKMTNCPEELLTKATIYFKIYFLGIPILMFYNFCASILRATGDTKRPMYFLILGGVIKVTFTIFFITVFDMTVEGVAIATAISFFVISLLAFITLYRSTDIIHIDFHKIRFDIRELKEILYIGIPSGLQTGMYSFANVMIVATVNSFGADATTGVAIANQFDGILYQITYAPSLAVIPYVAQNIGAKNFKRVKQVVLRAILIATAFGTTFGSLPAIFSGQLASIMASSDAVIAFAQQKMILISSTYFICGINEIMGGLLKGMGKPIFPTVSTFIFMCLFRFLWVYAIYPLFPQNLTFLYLVWPVGWILSIITLLIVYFPAIKKLERQN
ncbi:MAG: MATE family efflux transporter [Clostridia bacterium]|nr:MATE family efflux transporter [Clostridia bacterium]